MNTLLTRYGFFSLVSAGINNVVGAELHSDSTNMLCHICADLEARGSVSPHMCGYGSDILSVSTYVWIWKREIQCLHTPSVTA